MILSVLTGIVVCIINENAKQFSSWRKQAEVIFQLCYGSNINTAFYTMFQFK